MINNTPVYKKRCKSDQELDRTTACMLSLSVTMVFYSYFLILLGFCTVELNCFNIDTRTAILFSSPNRTDGIFFGFSVALHLHGNKTWVLVGAPLSNVTSPQGTILPRYGAVFKCDTTGSKECQDINVDNEPERKEFYSHMQKNISMEIKSGQMLGGTLQSKNDIVVACAPRYTEKRDIGKNPWSGVMKEPNLTYFLAGGCHVLQSNFSKIQHRSFLEPCKDNSLLRAHCQVGFSADVTKNSILMGKVGWSFYDQVFKKSRYWAGGFEKYSLVSDNYTVSPGTQQEKYEYLGYDVVSGYFSHPGKAGIAAGAPKGQNSKGKILIFDDVNNTDKMVFRTKLELPDNVNQIGTYFGCTLCAVDLNNDGLTDLLVGAPLFTDNKDEGRVYVYLNKKRLRMRRYMNMDTTQTKNLILKRMTCGLKWGILTHMPNMVLQGDNKDGARFGTAITNVGDLNRDGYQDVVIGAPYEGHNNSGAVYVYYGSKNGIEAQYRQKITASMINSKLKGFGYSISGAVDVDRNAYPDIAVGSYLSDQAVLLKTRRIVEVDVEIRLSRTTIVLENNEYMCNDEQASTRNKCLNVSICFRFQDRETSNRQNLKIAYNLEADADIPTIETRRMYFYHEGQRSFIVGGEFTIPSQRKMYCIAPYTVHVSHKYQFLDLLKSLTFDLTFSLVEKSCMLNPEFPCPVLDAYRPTTIRNDQLTIQKQCKGRVCQPDLSVTGYVNLPGGHKVLRVGSSGILSIALDIKNTAQDASYQTTVVLSFPEDLSYIGPTESKTVLCSSSYANDTAKAVCHIGNPFKAKIKKSLTIEFSAEEVKTNFDITVVVESKSNDTNLQNNKIVLPVVAKYLTDLQITGISQPSDVIYHGKALDKDKITRQSDIGPLIFQTILIENHGPSFVEGIKVDIHVPQLKTKYDPESILLYLREVELSGGPGRCNAITNPLSLPASNTTNQEKRRRQKRAVNPAMSSPQRMDCLSSVCYSFNCVLGLVPAGSSVRIKITARLWKSTFIRNKLCPSRLVTRAGLTVPAQVMQTNTTNDHVMIELMVRPGKDGSGSKEDIDWWIYLVAVLSGIFLLLFSMFIMYKFGFFSRTRPDDQKGSSEETTPMKV